MSADGNVVIGVVQGDDLEPPGIDHSILFNSQIKGIIPPEKNRMMVTMVVKDPAGKLCLKADSTGCSSPG